MIPDEIIEQVRDAADLVEIIGECVSLKRTGADWRGPCPFHGGTHRNFAVIAKKGLYYCYVCHEGGDVFTYLMKRFGMDYPTAVRDVARRVGVSIPERPDRDAGPDPREPLFGALAVAQEWFAARLRDEADAAKAREYLEGRDLPLAAVAELGLGFAPADKSFPEAMQRLGIPEAILIEAGLLLRREDGTVAPRFRGRLLFPIRDLRGRVVAFGGRLLGPGEPKYLNSPETPVFHKGSTLYPVHQAKNAIRKEGVVILVEGYFDVIRLVLAGVDHVVAPLGTALAGGPPRAPGQDSQAALLRRFAPAAILLYDSDPPGLRASFRAADELLRHGMRVWMATLPLGEDPDTLVRKGGAAALEPILADALDVLERKIQLLERKGWFAGVERRREALDRLLPTIRAASDPVTRDLYLDLTEKRVGVTRAVLEREVAAHGEPHFAPIQPPAQPAPEAPRPRQGRGLRGAPIEEKLLRTLFARPAWRERARHEVPPGYFQVPAYQEIYQALLALPAEAPLGDAAGVLSPNARDCWHRMTQAAATAVAGGLDLDAEYAGALSRLHDREVARGLPPVEEIGERQRQLEQLSPEARQRLLWLKQPEKGRQRRQPEPSPPSNPGTESRSED